MRTDEIHKLTRRRVAELIRSRLRERDENDFRGRERRIEPRWPFPGAVEIWPAGGDGRECWYGTCRNLSTTGIGMIADQPFTPGTLLEIACHFPEASLYGQARVCHCTEVPGGFLIGLQFDFTS